MSTKEEKQDVMMIDSLRNRSEDQYKKIDKNKDDIHSLAKGLIRMQSSLGYDRMGQKTGNGLAGSLEGLKTDFKEWQGKIMKDREKDRQSNDQKNELNEKRLKSLEKVFWVLAGAFSGEVTWTHIIPWIMGG